MSDDQTRYGKHHEAIHFLLDNVYYSSEVVTLVQNRERVIEALNLLAELPKELLVRWSNPNYG